VHRARELLTVALATLQKIPDRDRDLASVLDHAAAASSALYAAETELTGEVEALDALRGALDELTRALDMLHARTTFISGLDTVATAVAQALALLYPRVRSRERQLHTLPPLVSRPAARREDKRTRTPHGGIAAARRDGQPVAEQRTAGERVTIVVDVGVLSASNFYAGVTADVSAGGVFVSTDAPLAVGTEVALFFTLGGDQTLSTEGTVRWTRQDEPAGMGIAFTRLGEEDQRAIADYCANRPPLFHD
jgi:uncharacterized protein (TIGR02266 family)